MLFLPGGVVRVGDSTKRRGVGNGQTDLALFERNDQSSSR